MTHGSTKTGWSAGLFASVLALILQPACATPSLSQTASASLPGASCPGDNGGITLPKGFCATILADAIGHARQLVVAPDGTVYVNTWSGVYYKNDKPPGGFLVALKDTKGAGHADVVRRFGETFVEGGHGGTGIALYKGAGCRLRLGCRPSAIAVRRRIFANLESQNLVAMPPPSANCPDLIFVKPRFDLPGGVTSDPRGR
jgi:hypothetical protein